MMMSISIHYYYYVYYHYCIIAIYSLVLSLVVVLFLLLLLLLLFLAHIYIHTYTYESLVLLNFIYRLITNVFFYLPLIFLEYLVWPCYATFRNRAQYEHFTNRYIIQNSFAAPEACGETLFQTFTYQILVDTTR